MNVTDRIRYWVIVLATFSIITASLPAAAMGWLPNFNRTNAGCPRTSFFSSGISHYANNSKSMELVEVCLYDPKEKRGIKFRIPAAYINGGVNDESGYRFSVWLEMWMPDAKPASAIPILNETVTSKARHKYIESNRKDQILFSVTTVWRGQGYSEQRMKEMRDAHRWTVLPELGLEYFSVQCESLDKMKKEGRNFTTRKCDESNMRNAYKGYSDVSKGMLEIECRGTSWHCMVASNFHGYDVKLNIEKKEVRRVKEYEKAVNEFLRKYFVEIIR